MNRKTLLTAVLVFTSLALEWGGSAKAQSAYFQAVTNLNPVGYWPMQETTQPPMADVEVNLGSLGAVANAYYSSTNVTKRQAGVTGDGDASVNLTGVNGSFLAVPLTDPRVAVPVGPFTVEAWVNPANTGGFIGLVSQAGANPGGLNGSTNRGGWVLSQNYYAYQDNSSLRGWSFHVYNGEGGANGQPQGGAEAGVSFNYSVGTWYYLAAVFDGTNCTLYVNGTNINSTTAGYRIPMTGSYVRNTWDPLMIGAGRGVNANRFNGGVDEVAIYTNALTAAQVQSHYEAASGPSYSGTILGHNPYMYWRMNASTYVDPAASAYPAAANYGSVNAGGIYLSGTTPGLAGPSFGGFGSPSYACAFNGLGTSTGSGIPVYTNGVLFSTNLANTGIMITNLDNSFNLKSNFSISAMCWFKTDPANSRYQGLIGHGDNSWKLSLNTDGRLRWFPGLGGDFASSGVYNDGKWHFVVGVYHNTGLPATPYGVLATNYIYVDGVLDASVLVTNAASSGNNFNVLLGGAPDYFASGNNNAYNQRYFSGRLAHAAYFTKALSAGEVQSLYSAAQASPAIVTQPAASVTANGGTTNGFRATVSGASTLVYQWYYNGSSNYNGATLLTDSLDGRVSGSTTAALTITNLASGDNGYYYLVAANSYGSVTSVVSRLSVLTQPTITAQTPSGSFKLFAGQSTTLSVTATGAPTLSYQWYTNDVADTSAGMGATYKLTGVKPGMSGSTYKCVVSNTYGSVASAVSTLTVQALPSNVANSAYSSNILALNPTVYFPMHEVTAPTPGDSEFNHGTLGALGTGYYADWNVDNGNPGNRVILHQISGALAGDTDGATMFNFNGTANSYLLVPHTSPDTTLKPPFTIECWVWGMSGAFGDIVSQDGTALNTGNANNTYGVRLSWGGNIQIYPGGAASFSTGNLSLYQWHHVALTYDGTNYNVYVDGSLNTTAARPFVADSWDPLTIGAGLWNASGPTRSASNLAIDEVAIYKTNLNDATIYTHYNNGVSGSAGQYFAGVISDKPTLYYRMNALPYKAPDISTWSVMTNYGTAAINGVYMPGSMPGSVAGPNNGAGLNASGLFANTALPCNGLSTFASAFDPSVFNVPYNAADPVNDTPLTASVWFKSNPSDARFQTIFSHGSGSWQINQQVNGTIQFWMGNVGLATPGVYNDGNWHHVVVTHTGLTNRIYMNGQLVAIAGGNNYTNGPGNTTQSACIGTDPQYTAANNASGTGRQYAGSVCEAAFWNGTAISASQVQALYNAASLPPKILTQPISASRNQNSAFTNTVVASGSQPLTYQWYQNGLPRGGQTSASLILDPLQPGDASPNWYVVVSNGGGSVTSSVVSLTVNSLPVITQQPAYTNLTLYAGGHATFSVAAVGAQPISYVWKSNGVAIAGATNASYTLTNAQLGNATYTCTVTNVAGTAGNVNPVNVTVIAAPTAPYAQAVMAANPLGYWRLSEPENGLYNGNAGEVAHDYWGGNSGFYTNSSLEQPGYNSTTDPATTSALFGTTSFTDSGAFEIGGIDFTTPTNSSAAFSIQAWVNGWTQSTDAGIVTKGYGNGGEQFNLDTGGPSRGFRFFVRNAAGAVYAVSTSIQPGNTWHHLVAVCDQPNGAVKLYVDGVLVGTTAIPPGSGILASTNAMSIGSRKSGPTTAYNSQFVGYVNDVAVYNYALSASQVQQQYVAAGVPPSFSQVPPASASASEGGTLTVTAATVGTAPLTHQWWDANTGMPIAGQTNASLVISNVPTSLDGHSLYLRASNPYGSIDSSFVTVSIVSGPPQFTLNLPPKVTLVTGKTYTYSVTATGTLPIKYQWYAGATPITGQTNATYTLTAGSPGNYSYSVVINNIHGTVNSTVSTVTVVPQLTDAYASKVLGLGAVGYWPLQETSAPAMVTMETNRGTLGRLGNAYYAVTNADGRGIVGGTTQFGQGGALNAIGDYDPAVQFGGGSAINYAFVPRATPALTMRPPLTFEAWVNSSSSGFADIIGQGGSGLNSAADTGNGGGIRLSYGGNNGGGPNLQVYVYDGNGLNRPSLGTPAGSLPYGVWHHCVMTYDGTTASLYIDGQLRASGAFTMAIDTWSPLTIGDGFWTGGKAIRGYVGLLDEVAVYTNVLTATQITNHWLAGTTLGSNYVASVQADNPLLYYRMNSAGYETPDPLTFPAAVNYGSASPNGSYVSGIVPGGVAGPSISGMGNVLAAPINGVISCIDAGYDPLFNPTGTQPFTALTWFKGYPSDGVVQTIMSHGANWAMNLDGTTGRVVWNLNTAGNVTSSTVLNDGNWHFLAGVYDGATSSLYVDGVLDGSINTVAPLTSDPTNRVFLGGNALYNNVASNERFLAGALAQSAFFTNALTATQIQQIYNPVTVPVISLSRSGNQLVITYTGTLLSAPNAEGPYTPVPGATSPYYVTPSAAKTFYRTSNP